MKCKIITKDLLKELKEVFAEKVSNTIDEVQLHQVGNDIVLARSYVTKKSLRNVTKTCAFAYDFIEPLAKPIKLDFAERFLNWIKNADDIDTFLLTLNEDNLWTKIEYKTPMGEGEVCFKMANIKKEKDIINIGQGMIDVTKEDLSSMKNFVSKDSNRPSICGVYFDNGIMVATDCHVLKIRDTASRHTGIVGLDFGKIDETFPRYRAVLPTGEKNKYKIHCHKKEFKKFLTQWSKDDTTSNHLVKLSIDNGRLKASYRDIDYGIKKDKELWVQDTDLIPEGFEIGFDMNMMLKILGDKELNEEFDLRLCNPQSSVVIVQDNALWLQMPIKI